ncbi:MAG TPA: hypothetical protein VJN66_05280 [Rhodanobacteraceae bacterium]|nr:hypothetical protein [Rhodanobacteraceae bacterium]
MIWIVVVIVDLAFGDSNIRFVIPGLPKAEPDCVGRIANANAAGGAKRERHGWRESIGVVVHGSFKPFPGSVLRTAPE